MTALPEKSSASRPLSCGRLLWSLAWKLGLAVLLVYGAAQVLVRTDFFRSRVEAELSRLAGMEMHVGRIRATESLNLRIRDAIGVTEVAGIEARLARIRWRLFRPRGEPLLESVRVDGLALTVAPNKKGEIRPAFLGPLSEQLFRWAGLPRPEGLAQAGGSGHGSHGAKKADGLRLDGIRGPLIFRGVSVRWQDAEGRLLAAATGLDVAWIAMETPAGERVAHLDCRVVELRVTDGPRIRGLHLELVEAGGQRFLVALEADNWGAMTPPRPPGAEARELLDAMDVPASAP